MLVSDRKKIERKSFEISFLFVTTNRGDKAYHTMQNARIHDLNTILQTTFVSFISSQPI